MRLRSASAAMQVARRLLCLTTPRARERRGCLEGWPQAEERAKKEADAWSASFQAARIQIRQTPSSWCRRAATSRRRDDIAAMTAVTIQAALAHGDLVVWIGGAAGGMADRDLALASAQ